MHEHELTKNQLISQEMPRRPRQIFSDDVQQLRGVVSVITARSRVDGSNFFQVQHISQGGDVCWISPPLEDIDQADAAARTLASFVNAEVVR
jgi:hypothetical protein